VAAETCPRSFITAASLAWVEQFLVWKRLGYMDTHELGARDAEAFLILEQEWGTEAQGARQRERDDG
jgi:hypothetical protein